MDPKLLKEIRLLRALVAASILLSSVVLLLAFARPQKQRFAEIDVERINVVEKDGSLRLVISNEERSSGPIQ